MTITKRLSAKCLTIVACSMGISLPLIQSAYSATQAPNVVLAVSQSGSPVAGSSTVTYEVAVSNSGTAASGGFTVQASVPADTTVTQAQAAGAYCTGSWPCTAGEDLYWQFSAGLGAGASTTLQFSAQLQKTPPKDGTVISTTVVTSIKTLAAVKEQSLVRSAGGVNVGISCAAGAVASPGVLSCTLDYSNTGTSTIQGSLSYSFPSSMKVTAVTGNGSAASGGVTWGPLSLPAGSSESQTVNFSVPAGLTAGTILSQTAQLRPSTAGVIGATAGTEVFVASTNALDVGVSATPDPVLAGHAVTYSIHISNPEANSTAGFYVYASVPNYTSVTQAQAGGAYCTGSWPCTAGEAVYWGFSAGLGAGASTTLQFSAQVASGTTAPPAGSLLATTVSTGVGGSAVGEVLVGSAGPELALTAPEQVPVGGTYTYSLTYGNAGSSTDATDLTMAVPAGTTFVSASSGGTLSGGVVTWKAISLTAGQASSQQLTVKAPTSAGTVVSAAANLINATTLVSYTRGTADTVIASTNALDVGVSATPDPVLAGHAVTYSIHISNPEANSTAGFYVYASVPNYTSVTQAQAGGAYCTGSWPCTAGEAVYWGFSAGLGAGASTTLQFSAQVASGTTAPPAGSLLATTVSTGVGGSAVGEVLVGSAGPELALTAPEQVPVGGTYTYSLTYGNAGSSTDATDLTMAVPAGTTFVSASSGGTLSGGVVTWKAISLTAGQASSQQLTVKAPTSAGTVVSAAANLINATTLVSYTRGTADTVIASTNALDVGVSATPDPVLAGHAVTYSIHISNPEANSTAGFYVYASVPNYTSVTQAQAGGAYCTGSWPCTAGEAVYWGFSAGLGAGASTTLQFSAQVASGTTAPPAGSLLATTVSTGVGGSAVGEVLVGSAGPELALTAPEQVPVGGTYTYSLTYGNAGSSTDATDLTMAVPAGTTFVSASSGGTLSGGVVTWKAISLTAGQASSQQLTVKAPTSAGTVVSAAANLINATTLVSYTRGTADTVIASTNALDVGVSATPDPVLAGHAVTYSIHISNPEANSTAGFYVYASVPNYTSVTQAQAGGAYCTGSWPCTAGEAVYWGFSAGLGAGASTTLQFSAQVASGTTAPPAGSLLATTVSTGVGGSAVGEVLVGSAGPELALTAPEQVPVGGTYTYSLTYGNAGSSTDATDLTMAVPAGTTFVSASSGGTLSGGVVTWKAISLTAGQASSQQLTVKAPTSAGTVVSAAANLINATTLVSYTRGTADTVIASTNALDVGVSATPDPVLAGHAVTYSIHISNPEANSTAGFYVYASVPNYTSVTQAQAGGAYCTGSWPCTAGEAVYWGFSAGLGAGASTTLQFSAQVASGTTAPPAGSLLATTVSTGVGGSAVGVASVKSK